MYSVLHANEILKIFVELTRMATLKYLDGAIYYFFIEFFAPQGRSAGILIKNFLPFLWIFFASRGLSVVILITILLLFIWIFLHRMAGMFSIIF